MGTYEQNQIIQLLTAIQNTQDRIEEQNNEILSRLAPSSSAAEILSPSFPAANQPEQPAETTQTSETTEAPAETKAETTGETAGNTQTVGQTRIGAPE